VSFLHPVNNPEGILVPTGRHCWSGAEKKIISPCQNFPVFVARPRLRPRHNQRERNIPTMRNGRHARRCGASNVAMGFYSRSRNVISARDGKTLAASSGEVPK